MCTLRWDASFPHRRRSDLMNEGVCGQLEGLPTLMERSQVGHDQGDRPPPGPQVKPGAQFGYGCSSADHKVTRCPVAPENGVLAGSSHSRTPKTSSTPGPGASTGPEPASQRGLEAQARAAHVAAHSGPCLSACPAPPGPHCTLAAAMGARRRRLD